MNLWIYLFVFLFSQGAHAISQVGPKNVISSEDLFSLTLPIQVERAFKLPNSSLRILEGQTTNRYDLIPFSNIYNFGGWSREDTVDWFEDEEWFEILTDDCRVSYMKLTKGSVKGISTWGSSRGIVIEGRRTKWVQQKIMIMLQEVKLLDGACAW